MMNKETIEIAGIKVLKQRLQANPNNVDIFERDGEYYFTRASATREAKAQGLSLLSPEQFKTMAESFDGYREGEWCKAYRTLADVLGLKLSGYRYSGGGWYGEDYTGYSWSSVETPYFKFHRDEGKLVAYNTALSFPVVVFEDSTIGQFDNSEKFNESELKKLDKPTIKERLKDNDISLSSAYDIAEFVRDFNLLKMIDSKTF